MVIGVLIFWFCAVCVVFTLSIIGIYFFISSKGFQTAPPVPSSGRVKQALLNDISQKLQNCSAKTVVDLGSGWGTLLIPLAQKFPQHHFIGIEKAFFPYIISLCRTYRLKNIHFCRQDLFLYNISEADIVIVFLMELLMPRITDKCQAEMKKDSLLYSNRFPLTNMSPTDKIIIHSDYETIYKYRF